MSEQSFEFEPFDGDRTPHAQLQEWAEHYKVKLGWKDTKTQTGKTAEWSSYPIINERHYPQFIGSGKNLREAHRESAENIIDSEGALDEAKAIVPVNIARM